MNGVEKTAASIVALAIFGSIVFFSVVLWAIIEVIVWLTSK